MNLYAELLKIQTMIHELHDNKEVNDIKADLNGKTVHLRDEVDVLCGVIDDAVWVYDNKKTPQPTKSEASYDYWKENRHA